MAGQQGWTEVEAAPVISAPGWTPVEGPSVTPRADTRPAKIKNPPPEDPRATVGRWAMEGLKGGLDRIGGDIAAATVPISRRVLGMTKAQYAATIKDLRTAKTPAGKIGAGIGGLAEFAVPEAAAGKLVAGARIAGRARAAFGAGRVARYAAPAITGALTGAGTAVLTKLQGGTSTAANTAGAIAAVSPIAGQAMKGGVPTFRAWAETKLAKVFGGDLTDSVTRQHTLKEVVATAFDQGIPATWKGWITQARQQQASAGKVLEGIKAGTATLLVRLSPVADALQALEDTARVWAPSPTGPVAVGVKDPTLIAAIRPLKSLIQRMESAGQGYVESATLHSLKQTWNAFAGFGKFTPKTQAELILKAKARTARDGVAAIRAVFASENPDLSKADTAYHLATQLQDEVIKAAKRLSGRGVTGGTLAEKIAAGAQRTAATGLVTGAAAGGSAGYQSGHSLPEKLTRGAAGTLLGGVTGRLLQRAFQSPLWQTKGAKFYQALAEAVVAGRTEQVRQLITPLLAGAASGAASGAPTPRATPDTATPAAAPTPR